MLSDRDFEYRCSRADLILATMGGVGGLVLVGVFLFSVAGRPATSIAWLAVSGAAIVYHIARETWRCLLLERNGSVQVTGVAVRVFDSAGESASMRIEQINVLVSRRPLLTRLGRQPGWRFRLHGSGKEIPIYSYIEDPDGLEHAITTVAGLAAVEVRWWGRMYMRPIEG